MSSKWYRPAMPVMAAASCVIVGGCMPMQYRLSSPADPYGYIPQAGLAEISPDSPAYAPVRYEPVTTKPRTHTREHRAETKVSTVSVAPQESITKQMAIVSQKQAVMTSPEPAAPAATVAPQAAPATPPPSSAAQKLAALPVTPAEPPLQPIVKNSELPPVAKQLIDEGRALFKSGEILKARSKLNSAVSAPLGIVLLEVGKTFDPHYVGKLPKADAPADAAQARRLYEQAFKLGAQEARQELERMSKSDDKTP